jgi:hypothetical protein
MKTNRLLHALIVPAVAVTLAVPAWAQTESELEAGRWITGASMGFLGGTPDDTALAINGNADYFIENNVSIGPLLQFGVTDDMFQVGLSGQAKYWIPLAGTQGRGKLSLQSGIGFAHADVLRNDTSWLVPLGIGYEHTTADGTNVTFTTFVNFTDLHPGPGASADVMPGMALGLRF